MLKAQGAEVVEDPFAGTGLAEYVSSKNTFLGMETFFMTLKST